jgi:hypothetical protein
VRFSRSEGICRAAVVMPMTSEQNPNEQETDFLEVTDDLGVVKEVDRGHDQADEHGKDEQDVKVLAPIEFSEDDASNGEDVVHNQ